MIIIQARLSSTRYPLKILKKIGHKRIIDRVIERCLHARCGKVIVATPDPIVITPRKNVYSVAAPHLDEGDVSGRFAYVLGLHPVDSFVRVCADSPFVPSSVIQGVSDVQQTTGADYVYTEKFASGQQAEAFKTSTFLERLGDFDTEEREHVGIYFRKRLDEFHTEVYTNPHDTLGYKLSVDTPEDLKRIRNIFKV